MKVEIHQGTLPECLDDWPENHFAAVFGDDPYGLHDLSSAQVTRLMVAWLAGEDGVQADGMLGRKWDVVPPPRLNAEILRVMKPGALRLAYNGKSADLAGMSLRLAGFKMLPSFVRIHGGAMALGQSTGKAIDKAKGLEREVVGKVDRRPGTGGVTRGTATQHDDITAPASLLAAAFDGHASAVKVAHEPILCSRKPLDGTGADVAERHGVGGFNVQAGRIPTLDGVRDIKPGKNTSVYGGGTGGTGGTSGRYPSTIFFEHLEDCGATRCADGCPVAVVGNQAGDSGASPGSVIGGTASEHTSGNRSGRADEGKACGFLDSGSRIRVYYQGRASRRERHAGAEHLLWVRDADHADGWRLVDEAEFNRVGDEDAEEARQSPRYAEMMAPGYMRTSNRDQVSTGPYGSGRTGNTHRPRARVEDVDHLDADAFVEAARESGRCKGNPHLAVKAVDGGVYLAKLLLQPTIDGVEPVLLVPFCGSGSEIIAAMLAGWTRIVAYEMSGQMCELARARVSWWQQRIEAGHRGDALDMLRGWGVAPDVEPAVNAGQMSVFDVA